MPLVCFNVQQKGAQVSEFIEKYDRDGGQLERVKGADPPYQAVSISFKLLFCIGKNAVTCSLRLHRIAINSKIYG